MPHTPPLWLLLNVFGGPLDVGGPPGRDLALDFSLSFPWMICFSFPLPFLSLGMSIRCPVGTGLGKHRWQIKQGGYNYKEGLKIKQFNCKLQ